MRDLPSRAFSLTPPPSHSAHRPCPRTAWRIGQVLLPLSLQTALALACAARPLDTAGDDDSAGPPASTGDSDPGTTTGVTASPTTAPPTTATTDPPPTTGATTGSLETTGQSFISPRDGGPGGHDCDTWTEDCPEGQKCMPVSLDGDFAWESLRCVPIVDDPAGLYESCTVLGTGVDGLDTCDMHMMCWDWDPVTNIGHCVGMCTGSPDNPSCVDPHAFCALSGDSVLNLCLPDCNPLLQDCPGDNELCIPTPQDPGDFICVIDASGREGQVFDLCEFSNVCDPGLVCVAPELAAECDQARIGCCLPLCDTSEPIQCPGAGQQCLPWFDDDDMPPDDLEILGICGLPQ